jgi:serine/threonine protein kinase
MRLCPKCGKRSEEARCPDDGTATLVLAANPDSRLQLGTEVNGRYRIREMIGQGGFGAVYRATNIATDQDMAIKLLAVTLDGDDSDMIQRFFAEAQITASLKHPNTIRVFDFGQTEGGALYIAMELLSGIPLNELLRNRLNEGTVLTEEEAINIGVQSLRSLAEAHLANLVHRDLKPHNIFLHDVEGDDPVVKVLDFGIAKKLGSNLTGTGKAFGTPSYMSPEQAQNKPIDRRSDLYSLGCVLFQLVSGKPPFDGDNPLSVLLSHVTDMPPDLRLVARTPVSEPFVRVLEKALAKDPNERFATAIEMRQALEACRGADRTETLRAPTMSPLPMASSLDGADDKTSAYDAASAHDPRTAAYAVPQAPSATPQRGSGPAPTRQVPSDAVLQAGGDHPTFGFFSKAPDPMAGVTSGSHAVPDLSMPAEPEAAIPRKSNKLAIGLVAVSLIAAAVVAAVTLGGQKPEPAAEDPAKTPQLAGMPGQPNVQPGVKPVPPVAPVTPPPAQPLPPPVQAQVPDAIVKLVSDPPGAAVAVDGKVLGNAPIDVRVAGANRVTARLSLTGHSDLDVEVGRDDAPVKTVQLRAMTPGKVVAPVVKKAARPPGPKAPHDRSKSALEERL